KTERSSILSAMRSRFAVLLFAATAFAQDATVSISDGQLKGAADEGVRMFKGIPYAAPPIGPLRFKPPQPAVAWKDVRDATKYSAVCIQPGPRSGLRGAESEDCLYLNVWTTARQASEKRPVMLWIHGGGLQAGAGTSPIYNGSSLARKGAVVVTINYRLG